MKLSYIVIPMLLTAFSFSVGCTSFLRSSDQPEPPAKIELPETVGEATRRQGMGNIAVESVALVTGLPGTGSDPPPSLQRQTMLEEMKKRKVENPNQVLASDTTALVLVRAYLPPSVRKGDPLDIEVRVPSRSQTTSLAGGWLMESKLREVAILDQQVRSGHVRAVTEGPVLVDAFLQDTGDKVSQVRGRILGGGVATKSRPLGLTIRSGNHHVTISKMIGAAVNRRFDTYVRGSRRGAATPKTDKFIELTVHPRYRDNLIRYLRVIEQIQLRETPEQLLGRLKTLEAELLVPSTSSLTALRLEAIGEEAVNILQQGLESPSAEVRFYSAEALAYLDQPTAASHLKTATDESAFRSRAFLALGAMSSVEAHEELLSLLDVPSAETRYGAFRALQRMNPRDPVLGQEILGTSTYLHEVESQAEPLVHIARTRRPEIVIFGGEQSVKTPVMVVIDKTLVMKDDGGSLRITRFAPGKADQSRTCRATVNDMVRSLVEVEATYPEIVRTINEAKQQGALAARLAFDALPKSGRVFDRSSDVVEANSPETDLSVE